MSREAKEWSKASRRLRYGKRGGMHVYIDSESLGIALRNTNIPFDSDLCVKVYPVAGFGGNYAKLIIKIKKYDG